MNQTKEVTELAKARSQRVRGLREALRYSRQKFCKRFAKHGVSYSALQSWESIRWNGLPESGARKLAACFQEEGLEVTIEWLLFGIGNDPFEEAVKKGIANILPRKFFKDTKETKKVTENPPQEKSASVKNASAPATIVQELKLFHQLNPGSVDALVTDDGLSPWLSIGDQVAGQRYFDQDMEKGIGHPCIVQSLTGKVLVRILERGHDVGYFTLTCTNPETTVTETTIENIQLFSVTPILWIRKPG